MNSPMGLDAAFPGETFETDIALERLLAGVHAHVPLENRCDLRLIGAVFTGKQLSLDRGQLHSLRQAPARHLL